MSVYLEWFGAGWLAVAGVMAALWLVQRRTGNAGIVDVAWSSCIGLLAAAYALASTGPGSRRAALAAMALLWGLRLAWHIHARSVGKPEDGRYQQLRREWGDQTQPRMFRFYQLQAFVAAFFALPFLLSARDATPHWRVLEILGAILWVIAWLGESLADRQLEAFKRDPANRGQVCRRGLWNYSRHPNYFFEWLIWCAFALFALPAPGGSLALLCPALILYFLFKVTGIPATEAQALRSKGDAYRDYQRTTPAFFPWWPRT